MELPVGCSRAEPDFEIEGTGPVRNVQTQTPPYPHPPKLAGWDPQTPEHCFGQAEGSLSNPGTLRLVNSFDQFGGPVPDRLLGGRICLELTRLFCIRSVEIQWAAENKKLLRLSLSGDISLTDR